MSLDLVAYLIDSQDWDAARDIATETVELFKPMCSHQPTLEALILWKEGVVTQTLSKEALTATREALQDRVMHEFRQSRVQQVGPRDSSPLESLH